MSIGCVISGLHEGISKSKLSLFSLILKPRLEIILIISFFSILNPVIFSNKEISNFTLFVFSSSNLWISNLLTSPPHTSLIRSAALISPASIDFGSIPLSNLNFASVSIFNNFEVFLIDLGKKYADSSNIFFVSSSVPERVPPMIPPSPNTPDWSEITHISSSREYFLLSSASKVSPFFEFLTIISLLTLSASYAWSGLFKSIIT